MTRPIFGDPQTIQRIDPWRVLLDDGIDLPVNVLGCAECDSPLHVEFDDTWIDGIRFGAGTIRWYCTGSFEHDQGYTMQDEVESDEQKIVKWIRSQYPTFENFC